MRFKIPGMDQILWQTILVFRVYLINTNSVVIKCYCQLAFATFMRPVSHRAEKNWLAGYMNAFMLTCKHEMFGHSFLDCPMHGDGIFLQSPVYPSFCKNTSHRSWNRKSEGEAKTDWRERERLNKNAQRFKRTTLKICGI